MDKEVNKEEKVNECPLKKHTPKSFLLAFVLGVFIGLAIRIPGISGSTVAIIFGMYAAMLYALGNILNDFKRCIMYLIPIGLGAIIGFLGGFLVIQKLFGEYMFVLVGLFAGLMIGAIPALTAEVKGEKKSASRIGLFALGIIIPICVGVVSIMLGSGNASSATFTEFPAYLFILYIPLGVIVSTTQIVPGLSATAILMACGQFGPILNSLHVDYILNNPAVIGLYLCIGGGFLAGIVVISRLFSKIIEKRRAATFFLVVGLSIGSIISMFLNLDMWEIYSVWSVSGIAVDQLIIGGVLLAVGFIASFLLTKYELNRNNKTL